MSIHRGTVWIILLIVLKIQEKHLFCYLICVKCMNFNTNFFINDFNVIKFKILL